MSTHSKKNALVSSEGLKYVPPTLRQATKRGINSPWMRDKKGKKDKGKLDESGKKKSMKTNGVAENVSYMEWNHSTNLSELKGQPLEFHHDHSYNKGLDAYLPPSSSSLPYLLPTLTEPLTPPPFSSVILISAITTTIAHLWCAATLLLPSSIVPTAVSILSITSVLHCDAVSTVHHHSVGQAIIAVAPSPSLSPKSANPNFCLSRFQFDRTTNHTPPSLPLPLSKPPLLLLFLQPESTPFMQNSSPVKLSPPRPPFCRQYTITVSSFSNSHHWPP
ncbi:hypothetical protein PIB30_079787 [Stylosanthes scabra]|uniref:Uncharacterized protein n=1 Tax=Stylosanthes scabra TaxID=79078 RepID=A0ABU6ZPZ1_9FABA|nr:hypothetical protein [Stylosanthes scabra]